ncbi:MAG: hypothetical protein HKN13_04530, partial [Rhodothermales bacterium]|nr:hypothetical protein [Rhodothermales bacterium]
MNERLRAEYQTRREHLVEYFASLDETGYSGRVGLFELIARTHQLRLGGARSGDPVVSDSVSILNDFLEDPHGDMFWMLPMAALQVVGAEVLPRDVLKRMRDQWRTYTPYRGDTENHWLMYYASLLIMSERYPADASSTWFNGRSSNENRAEATAYLKHWFRLVLESGQCEFDSPHYLPMYLAPLALIRGFSTNEEMRHEADVMLDVLVADFAADSLNGLYVGAFSRIYPEPVLARARNPSTTFSWLLFGNVPLNPDAINIILRRTGYRPHAAAVLLAISGYEPAPELYRAATDRSTPYVHRELKRSRNHLRYARRRYAEVFKYAYVRKEFAMGSIATLPADVGDESLRGTGLVQPIQQHTWELFWNTGDPGDEGNLLFAIHPYSSADEMGLFFPEEPRMMTKLVVSQEKPTYDLASKWTGGSPYE